jgi:hypothetical protein
LVLLAYSCLSAAAYGLSALGDLHNVIEGSGQSPAFYGRDQSFYAWSLAWTARSAPHLRSLFLTRAVFAPFGYNLAWAASIFGPALLLAPVTLLLGAVASYNLLALAAPATAAWTAFLLGRQLAARPAPAFAGGLLFGFGTYESVEMVNHVSLALIALLPLAALLVLRRHAGQMSRRRFAVILGAVLALQLWTASEVFASLTIFGALAFSLGALLAGRGRRSRIALVAVETLGALLLALVLAGPYLYYALRYPNPVSGISGADAGTDLANFVTPTQVTWLHSTGGPAASAAQLRGNITEQLAYLGLPLILLLGACAIELRRSLLGRCLLAFALTAALASLGAHLFVDGHSTGLELPWSIAAQLPLLRFASPGRFVVYVWLAAAMMISCWLTRPGSAPLRWACFAIVAVSLAPNVSGLPWGTPVDAPRLLATPTLARYVPAGATVLALPFGIAGDSMFWQLETNFRFRLAGGYVSVSPPAAYRRYLHLIHALGGGRVSATVRRQLCGFIDLTHSDVILLRDHTPGYWAQLLDPLGLPRRDVGGFTVYELDRGGRSSGRCATRAGREP